MNTILNASTELEFREMEFESLLGEANRERELEAARTDLRAFTKLLWPVRESSPFQDNWVIGALCEHLTACYERQIRRLIINIYFRSGKSSVTSVFFPAWVWGQKPEERFLFMSYAQSLALRDAGHTRELFEAPQYKTIFPDSFIITKDSVGYYENNKTGSRISIGSGAQQTGFGAGVKVFDDPNDVNKVESPVIRESTNNRFDNLSTRSDDFSNDVWILIQQRTHVKDVTGHVDELGLGFEKLIIPLEYDGKKSVTSLGPIKDPRTKMGAVADPGRFPPQELAELKKLLGYRYHGQANQDPRTPEGNAIRMKWYGPYCQHFEPSLVTAARLAYDVSFTDSENGDWTWGSWKIKQSEPCKFCGATFHTLFQHFGHWDNVERRKQIGAFGLQVADAMKTLMPNVKWKLTEEAGIGGGTSLVNEDIKYLQAVGLPAETVTPEKQAKPVRAIAYLGSCQGGGTKFYAGLQLKDFGLENGTELWINPFFDVVSPLMYSDDGLRFVNGNDDPIDGEVMAHEGCARSVRDWKKYKVI